MTASSLPGVFHKRKLFSDIVSTKKSALIYPSFLPVCCQGLGSSIGRASHRKCECVTSIPTASPEIFFSRKENLGTCIQVL